MADEPTMDALNLSLDKKELRRLRKGEVVVVQVTENLNMRTFERETTEPLVVFLRKEKRHGFLWRKLRVWRYGP